MVKISGAVVVWSCGLLFVRRSHNGKHKQERLAVASIARDDPSTLPAMIPSLIPACTATAMRGKLGSEFET